MAKSIFIGKLRNLICLINPTGTLSQQPYLGNASTLYSAGEEDVYFQGLDGNTKKRANIAKHNYVFNERKATSTFKKLAGFAVAFDSFLKCHYLRYLLIV